MKQQSEPPAFERALTPSSNCSSGLSNYSWANLVLPDPQDAFKALAREIQAVEGATVEVVNAGLGTSATRTLHNEICAVGKPSLHYAMHCGVNSSALVFQENMLRLYDDAKKCANQEYSRDDVRCCVKSHREQLLGNLTAVIKSGVQVLADVPYTNLVPVLRMMIPGLKVVQTLRGTDDWTQKRLEHNTDDIICRHPALTRAATFFDVFGCLIGNDENHSASLVDVFEPIGDEKLAALGVKYSHHNSVIARTTSPTLLRQLCAWDVDEVFDQQLEDTVIPLLDGVPPEIQPLRGNNLGKRA